MGYTDEDVETHTFLPHIILPGVHVTPSVLATALEQAVATFILYMRIWGLQKAAPARKWRARMPIQIPVVPKPILSPLYLQEGLKSTAQEVGMVHAKAVRQEGQLYRNLSSERSGLSGPSLTGSLLAYGAGMRSESGVSSPRSHSKAEASPQMRV